MTMRAAAARAEQLVDDEERVALTGVRIPKSRTGRSRAARTGARLVGVHDVDAHAREGEDDGQDAAHEPAHQVVVRLLHAVGPDPAPELRRDPEGEARDDRRHVTHARGRSVRGVRRRLPKNGGQDERDEDEQRRQDDEQRLDEDDARGEHEPADELGGTFTSAGRRGTGASLVRGGDGRGRRRCRGSGWERSLLGLGLAGGHHVHLDAVGQRGEVAEEAVPARSRTRPGRPPTASAAPPCTVDAADVHDVDRLRAEGDGAPDRDAVDDPAVEEALAVDEHRGRMPGTAEEARTASTSAPPVNHRSEADSIEAATHWNGSRRSSIRCASPKAVSSIRRTSTLSCRVRVRTSVLEPPRSPPPNASLASNRVQLLEAAGGLGGVGRDERAADRADRRPEHHVGDDAAPEQPLEHPHPCEPRWPPPPRTNAVSRSGTAAAG